jgi:RNA polymerase sigma-70 factor, ECF subfamily
VLDDMRRGLMFELLNAEAERRDVAAFNTLFEYYHKRLQPYLILRGASKELAEDIGQQTLSTVWHKAGLYGRDKGTVSSWIFTIARHRSIDEFRKVRRGQHASVELAKNIPSMDARADDRVASRQCENCINAALAALSTSQREILDLAYFRGMSHSQISTRLSLAVGTVKFRIRLAYHRARFSLEDLR